MENYEEKEKKEKKTEELKKNEEKTKDLNEELKEKEATKKEEQKSTNENEVKKEEKNIKKENEKIETLEKKKEKKVKSGRTIKWIIIAIILILVSLIATTGFAILNMQNTNIISGVTVEGVPLKGLNREQAIQKLEEEFNNENKKKVHLTTADFEYYIEAEQIEFQYNIEETIDYAYNYGRVGNIFKNNYEIFLANFFGKNFELKSTYNQELLDNIINDISTKIPNAVIESDYYIEDETLIITSGTEGNSIDKELIKEKIVEKLRNNDGKDIIFEVKKCKPQSIDIERIYNEVHSEPKDAYYTKEPFKVFPHVDGIDFDIEQAKEILKEEQTEYRIPLKITHPNVLTKDIGDEAFPDLLGTFSTRYVASNVNRTTNLKIAANKINGTVLAPGETFSYNRTVGERTIAAGYKNAAGYEAGEVVDMLAGGICQISSTLYDAVVYANLDIVSRSNHMFLTSYTPAGKDATVVYGAIDFKFKNTRKNPILIKMSVQNGIAKADIYGIKEDVEYEIAIDTTILNYIPYSTVYKDDPSLEPGVEKVKQSGMNGCKSITYKIKKLNGVEVSREVLSSDTYKPMNKIISRGPIVEVPPVQETPVEPTPIQPTPSEPIVPETPTPEIPKEPEQEEPIQPVEPSKPDDSEDEGWQGGIEENPVINGI
ncbi:MAG: VanW family protein [Clostridia bacterium]|nr:VanW family protein [Clostridia bacterium]